MHAVWICAALCLLLIFGVCFNAYYIGNQAKFLTQAAEQMQQKEERETLLTETERFWEKHRAWFGLSVGFRELDHFGEVLTNLRWAHDAGNDPEFERYRLLLIDAIEEISRTERLALETIF